MVDGDPGVHDPDDEGRRGGVVGERVRGGPGLLRLGVDPQGRLCDDPEGALCAEEQGREVRERAARLPRGRRVDDPAVREDDLEVEDHVSEGPAAVRAEPDGPVADPPSDRA